MNDVSDGSDAWMRYRPGAEPHDLELPPPPPWRSRTPPKDMPPEMTRDQYRGSRFKIDRATALIVNAAMYLRRALLVTGTPGSGKSTLAYSIAWQLKLGPVLKWVVTSSSTRKDALYSYDAIGRMQATQMAKGETPSIEEYLSLGPLGSALAPSSKPRVLLIDEIDKSDVDLPNDLLDMFEDGEFEIDELRRLDDDKPYSIRLYHGAERDEGDQTTEIRRGRVTCTEFPIVVMTSNNERVFPPAFMRRCLQLDLGKLDVSQLEDIVHSHLAGDEEVTEAAPQLIRAFDVARETGQLATDQLLNAVYLVTRAEVHGQSREDVLKAIYRPIAPP